MDLVATESVLPGANSVDRNRATGHVAEKLGRRVASRRATVNSREDRGVRQSALAREASDGARAFTGDPILQRHGVLSTLHNVRESSTLVTDLEGSGDLAAYDRRITGMSNGSSGLGKRIAEVLRAAGSNPHKASIELGISRSTLTNWLKEVSTPDTKNLRAFAEKYGANFDWLTTGRGKRDSQEAKPTTSAEHERIQAVVDEYLSSPLSRGVSPRIVELLKGNPYTALGIDIETMTILDVQRVADLIALLQRHDHLR